MGDKAWWTVECPWLGNLKFESCIPEGDYAMVRTDSSRFGKEQWEIVQVPNRGGIRVHVGNTAADVQGCIALGKNINADFSGIANSRAAIAEFVEATRPFDTLLIEIRWEIVQL